MPIMSVTQDGEILQVGMACEAKFRGTTFRPGRVTNVRPDGTVDIAYVDGDTVRGHERDRTNPKRFVISIDISHT